MDNNGYYGASGQFNDYNRPSGKEGRGGNAFATIVIVIVLVLLALLVIGLFWPQLLGQPAMALVTPTPAAAAPDGERPALPEISLPPEIGDKPERAEATATPAVSDEDRDMPVLDGKAPLIPTAGGSAIPDIYDAVSPGVVGVLNYVKSVTSRGTETYTVYGSGTGFAVSSQGYILTNAHVAEGADRVTVTFDGDEEEHEAKIIGMDAETDVAVLKVEGVTLHPLALGDSDAVRVGEFALAIGNPLSSDELANTLTYGIISATAREITIDNYTNTYLQTDAAINFGNSGGPLINMQGLVIGINSAKTITAGYDEFGNAVSAEGIGFALPINQVKRIMEVLITKGYIERPGIGVTVNTGIYDEIVTVTEEEAYANSTPVGARVESVVKGRPAEEAGLLAGDIITEADGKTIQTHEELVSIVTSRMIGDELTLKVYRAGAYLDLTVIIGNKSEMDFGDVAG